MISQQIAAKLCHLSRSPARSTNEPTWTGRHGDREPCPWKAGKLLDQNWESGGWSLV